MRDHGFSWPSFGVFHQGWATEERSDAEVLADVIRSTVHADRLGFDVAWFTEQHTRMFGATWGRIAAPQLLIAHTAACTDRIGLGTAVRLIADEDVLRIAEELLTLDLLTEGRVQFGIGTGMGSFSQSPAEREARRETLRTRAVELARLLRGEAEVTPETFALDVRDLSNRIHIATTDPHSMAMAAQEGFGYLAGMFGGRRHAQLVREFHELGGRGLPGPLEWSSSMTTTGPHVGRSEPPPHISGSISRRLHQVGGRQRSPCGPIHELDDICAQLGWIVGGPASVAAHLADYMITSGLDGVDLSFHVPGLDTDVADRAMEIFALTVRPEVVKIVHAAAEHTHPR